MAICHALVFAQVVMRSIIMNVLFFRYQLAYAVLLVATVHHAFVTLYLDPTNGYELVSRRFAPFLFVGCLVTTLFLVAPSAIYSRTISPTQEGKQAISHFRQFCDFEVPPILAEPQKNSLVYLETAAAYRLCYEVKIYIKITL